MNARLASLFGLVSGLFIIAGCLGDSSNPSGHNPTTTGATPTTKIDDCALLMCVETEEAAAVRHAYGFRQLTRDSQICQGCVRAEAGLITWGTMYIGVGFAYDLDADRFHRLPETDGFSSIEEARSGDRSVVSKVRLLPEPQWADQRNRTFLLWEPRNGTLEDLAANPLPDPTFAVAFDGRYIALSRDSLTFGDEVWSYDTLSGKATWLYNTTSYSPGAPYGYHGVPALSAGKAVAEYSGPATNPNSGAHLRVFDLANGTQKDYTDWRTAAQNGIRPPQPFWVERIAASQMGGTASVVRVHSLETFANHTLVFPDESSVPLFPLGLQPRWIPYEVHDAGPDNHGTGKFVHDAETNTTYRLRSDDGFSYSLQTLNAWVTGDTLIVLGRILGQSPGALYWIPLPPTSSA